MVFVNENNFVQDDSGIWLPPLNLKQFEIFNDYHRYILVEGPRKSGKTFGIIHKILRHAFDVNGAMVAIVTKTIKNAKSAGVWVLLSKMLKIWEAGCPGFKVIDGPRVTGDSKMSFVRVRCRNGSVSEIQCHSLEHATEVEAKFKGPAYSMFFLSELDQYCTHDAFDIFCDALRMWPAVKYEEHQIICDCNPPNTGTNNWIHDKWFKFKEKEFNPEEDHEDDKVLRDSLSRIHVMIDDNPQLDPRERKDLEARYRKRKTLYNRFILGIWEQDIVDGHFSDVWDETVHVLGKDSTLDDEREVLVPTPACTVLLTGWDPGESKNHSFHILEKIVKEEPKTKRAIVSFSVIDELVVIRQFVSIWDFAEAALEKMEHWERWMKSNHNVQIKWRHWSDTSVFRASAAMSFARSAAEATHAAIVQEATNDKVILDGAPKYRNSNRDRVKLIWQLLYEKRLHISAQLHVTRTMFANLRSGTDGAEFIKQDDHKHPFDSLSYPISAEAPADMVRSAELTTAPKENSPRLVVAGG